MTTAGMIRILLVVDMIAMMLLALAFIRQRRMDKIEYWVWGLMAVALPVIGPFLVIARRPGVWEPSYSFVSDFHRLISLLRRVLPEPVSGSPSRLRRSRQRKTIKPQR